VSFTVCHPMGRDSLVPAGRARSEANAGASRRSVNIVARAEEVADVASGQVGITAARGSLRSRARP
jgi:hypothetical protein